MYHDSKASVTTNSTDSPTIPTHHLMCMSIFCHGARAILAPAFGFVGHYVANFPGIFDDNRIHLPASIFIFIEFVVNRYYPTRHLSSKKSLALSAPASVGTRLLFMTGWRHLFALHVLGTKYQCTGNFSTCMLSCSSRSWWLE